MAQVKLNKEQQAAVDAICEKRNMRAVYGVARDRTYIRGKVAIVDEQDLSNSSTDYDRNPLRVVVLTSYEVDEEEELGVSFQRHDKSVDPLDWANPAALNFNVLPYEPEATIELAETDMEVVEKLAAVAELTLDELVWSGDYRRGSVVWVKGNKTAYDIWEIDRVEGARIAVLDGITRYHCGGISGTYLDDLGSPKPAGRSLPKRCIKGYATAPVTAKTFTVEATGAKLTLEELTAAHALISRGRLYRIAEGVNVGMPSLGPNICALIGVALTGVRELQASYITSYGQTISGYCNIADLTLVASTVDQLPDIPETAEEPVDEEEEETVELAETSITVTRDEAQFLRDLYGNSAAYSTPAELRSLHDKLLGTDLVLPAQPVTLVPSGRATMINWRAS